MLGTTAIYGLFIPTDPVDFVFECLQILGFFYYFMETITKKYEK